VRQLTSEEAAVSVATSRRPAAVTHIFFVSALGVRSGSNAATEAAPPVKES
jgi:hypothetical protein